MHVSNMEPIFENRYDAGRQLAVKLMDYKGKPAVVLAIPNGGASVGLSVALALEANYDLIISRKIPLPLSPEGGFGAVTDDGTTMLNDEIVQKAGLSQKQINYQVNQVRADIRQRSLLYHKDRALRMVSDKTVIIVDDGVATGYTMMAAVASVRQRRPKEIIAAVPVAPDRALGGIKSVADKVVTCAVGHEMKFYVSDYYRYWHELSNDEVIQCLKEWEVRRYRAKLETLENK